MCGILPTFSMRWSCCDKGDEQLVLLLPLLLRQQPPPLYYCLLFTQTSSFWLCCTLCWIVRTVRTIPVTVSNNCGEIFESLGFIFSKWKLSLGFEDFIRVRISNSHFIWENSDRTVIIYLCVAPLSSYLNFSELHHIVFVSSQSIVECVILHQLFQF
jgi:hypothetical protein